MAEKRFLEIDYPIIPSGEFHVVKAENVGWGEDDLDDVLQGIEDYLEMHDGNIKNIDDSISGLDTRVTALEESKGTVIKIKGRVNTVDDLPANASAGDMYFVGTATAEQFEEYVFTEQGRWEYLGSINDVDLSDYVTKTFLANQLTGYAKKSDIPTVPTNYLTGGSQTTKSTADGGKNVYTFTKSDGTTSTLEVFNGTKGSKGDTGPQGPQGEQGIQGIQGPQGLKGDTGAKGDKGDTGATGATGPKGDTGDTGATGPQGPAGKNGTNGTNGVSCTHSWNGTTLTVTSASGTSSANLKGEKGDKGDTGAAGTNGTNGTNGKDGVTPTIKAANGANIGSVGTPAVTASTSGTTTTFTFNYLKGAKGDKGDKGETGSTGPQGPQGPAGTTAYPNLTGKPSINGTELNGNVSLGDIGLKTEDWVTYTKTDANFNSTVMYKLVAGIVFCSVEVTLKSLSNNSLVIIWTPERFRAPYIFEYYSRRLNSSFKFFGDFRIVARNDTPDLYFQFDKADTSMLNQTFKALFSYPAK